MLARALQSALATESKQPMNPFAQLAARLKSRPDSEHEQAVLRILIIGLIWGYMGALSSPAQGEEHLHEILVHGLGGFFAIAIGIFSHIAVRPAPNLIRRGIGMLADTGGATFYMCLGGAYGAGMLAVYLFVTFGNGFRFGRKHLFACQALSIIGFSAVLSFIPFWQAHLPIGIGLLISLVVLPLYVSTLLKRIHEARQRAEEANTAKTAFLANMSHEMRTPLNGIVGAADLLATTSLTSQQSELVGLLRHSVRVLRSLVDDVLDITKIESGRLTLEVVPFDVYRTAIELIEILQPPAKEKRLALLCDIDPEVNYFVEGDPHHIRQVLLNLLGNAIKFTERGSVTLRVKRGSSSADRPIVRFEVQDTGIGIAPESLERIFERFVQADESTTRRFGGTGLGTTIAKQLVEHMGGTIGVASVVGRGSIFWFELPLPSAAEDPTPVNEDEGEVVILSAWAPTERVRAAIASSARKFSVVNDGKALRDRLAMGSAINSPVSAVVALGSVEWIRAQLPPRTDFNHLACPPFIVVVDDEVAAPVTMEGIETMGLKEASLIAALPNVLHYFALKSGALEVEQDQLGGVLKTGRVRGNVLVAEDNRTNQKILQELLSRAGHTVTIAADGEAALEAWESKKPDIAILDYNMPLRTGCEVIQAIRVMEEPGSRTPAIILSASVTPESKTRALQSGADAFIGKPFDARQLLQVVDTLLAADSNLSTIASDAAQRPKRDTAQDQAEDGLNTSRMVNWARVRQLEEIARNAYFVTELLRGFKDDSERLLVELRLALQSHQIIAMGDAAHALKGAAVGVGATTLADCCSRLEQLIQASRPDSKLLGLAVEEIDINYRRTLAELDAYTQSEHNFSLVAVS